MSTQGASLLSSTSSSRKWIYDVFLSFRGEDTRNNFTCHLYAALQQKGIFTFRDDESLEKGKYISPELLKAIEESRFAIVILSRNFASSTWCLDELAKIIQCMKEMEMTILPIFYDVDPSDVRKQMGTFAQAFAEHEKRFEESTKKVQTWRAALTDVANISGWHSKNRPEAEVIEDIVKMILNKLSNTSLGDTKGLVGITSRVEELMKHLAIESNDVRIIGIWGMGGIGKTTLARVVYGMISNQFEACSFIANAKEVYEKYGLLQLQRILLNDLLIPRDINIQDIDNGVLMIKSRLRHKRILIVLDDVNELDQLNKLVVGHDWFGPGSRVIITTRDVHLLKTLKVDGIYKAKGLSYCEALHLFNLKAFKTEHPIEDYLQLSQAFVQYAKGLPLAIEVLGSFLYDRSTHEWKSELDRLKEFPERKILNVLQISFDGLEETEKEIFVNIACFFNHKNEETIIAILNCLDLYPIIGLRVLIDKSLIKLQDNQLWMHDLLQEMGRDIVRQECPIDPGKRSRLWLYKDIDNVLTKNMGTKKIQGIVLSSPKPKKAHWNPKSFAKMHRLKLLIIDNVQLIPDPKYLPNDLRFLNWSGYPSKSLPTNFQPNELIELHMCCSNIERLWKGTKSFEMLKFIELKGSLKFIETPIFTEIPILEKLVLEDCINLCEIHPSIGVHKKLTHLNLKGCKNLTRLPRKFEMDSLEILILSNCSKVKRIPKFGANMGHVLKLYLDGTAIAKLPASIGHLTSLALLNVRNCKNLLSLPISFFNMKSLEDLNLSGCSKLMEKLWNAKSVEDLDVSGIVIRQRPSTNARFKTFKKIVFSGFQRRPSMSRNSDPMVSLSSSLFGFCSLTSLKLIHCNLKTIPSDIGCLFSLQELYLSGNNFDCLPETITQLSMLKYLGVVNCKSLRLLPKLPLSIGLICGSGCSSLETMPNLLKPNFSCEPELVLLNCSKLVDNQNIIDAFFAVIRKSPQVSLSLSLSPSCEHHPLYISGFSTNFKDYRHESFCPGSEIPEWFSHQSTGAKVYINEPFSHLFNEWIGIAFCVVFCSLPHHQLHKNDNSLLCLMKANGKVLSPIADICDIGLTALSDHIWLLYFLRQLYMEGDISELLECDSSGLSHIGVEFEARYTGLEVKKCGFRIVYKKDIEDLNRTMAQFSSNNNNDIIPYEGLDVPYHNFNYSTVVVEGNEMD